MIDKDYSDIINLPHHTSKNRTPMTLYNRAAQFAPFSALNSYEDSLRETSRITEELVTLSDNQIDDISFKLQVLEEHLKEPIEVTIKYFQKDNKKKGGAYLSITGIIKKFDYYNRTITFTNQTVIHLDDIIDIHSPYFSCYEF